MEMCKETITNRLESNGLRDIISGDKKSREVDIIPDLLDHKKYFSNLLKCGFRRPTLSQANNYPLRKWYRKLLLRSSKVILMIS